MKIFWVYASTNSKHHGEFWSKIKPLLASKKKKLIILLENFNSYLSEAAVNMGVERVIDDLEITQASNLSLREAINCFLFNTVSKSYMKGILDKLNPQKAVGCDSTPSGFYGYQLLP